MTTPALLARASVLADEVRAEANRVDLAKALLTLLFVVPFLCGWLAAQTVRAAVATLSWTWAAVVVGWRTAYGRGGQSDGET